MTSMRWTADDLKRYEQRAGASPPPPIAAAPDTRSDRRMNKLEAAYALILETRRLARAIKAWRFEAIKLRLADHTYYTPDFAVVCIGGELEMHETKGHWREDAKVKIKVAAELFPWFRFLGITRQSRRDGGGWVVEEF